MSLRSDPLSSLEYKKLLCHSDCKIVEVHETDVISASLVKYSINTFLASKVIFFNQLYDIYKALTPDIKWDEFITMINSDDRIGESHMDVPGHDGKLGFGGSCFPKDIQALIHYAKSLDVNVDTLIGVWKTNLKVRPEKDWEKLKGRAILDET